MLFAADLHYTLKQLDWLVANAERYDLVIIGGDLLDLGSALDFDVQIVVVEKYLRRIRRYAPLLVSSGNHDGDSRNAADESVAKWLLQSRTDGLYVDGESAVFGDLRITACPIISGPRKEEKNGTAQRPSLPEMNEFLVGRVAEAPCSAFVKPL
jgi:predicted MPP superfamily phosphohydrolase